MDKTVYYHDTDAGGVVYYGRYLEYLEEARTEFLARRGLTVEVLKERGFLYAVRRCRVDYKRPARYGDRLSCEATLTKITAAQMIFHQTVRRKDSGILLVEAEVALVSLSKDFKPVVIPDDIRSLITA